MQSQNNRDRLFAEPLGEISSFRFDQSVVDVFPDMLKRSIPGYQSIITQSGLLAARFAQADTRLYDLGCSLGATTLAMRSALQQRHQTAGDITGCSLHAVDNSPAMIERCRNLIDTATGKNPSRTNFNAIPITLHCQDIQTVPIVDASVVTLNFTLQFIPVDERASMIRRIAENLVPGGVLILSEKVTFDDPDLAALHIAMYHEFKHANGYSELEISQKRTALENVLIPETLNTHNNRLAECGFTSSSVWFQCFNFASMIAIKM